MTTKRTYKTYPPECKAEAVALLNEQSYSVQKATNSLGIRSNRLYRWKHSLEAKKAGKLIFANEHVELTRLQKEILKKSAPYSRRQ